MDEIKKYDSNFSGSAFKTYVDNIFIQIHTALMTKELEKIRHFVSDEVYQNYQMRINELNNQGLIQMYDELNVKETILLDSKVMNNEMRINVKLISRYMDYLINESGDFVSGVNDYRVEKENYLTFAKKISATGQGSVRKCPGCGVSMDVNENGVCAYCGSVYNLSDKDWILISIETI